MFKSLNIDKHEFRDQKFGKAIEEFFFVKKEIFLKPGKANVNIFIASSQSKSLEY